MYSLISVIASSRGRDQLLTCNGIEHGRIGLGHRQHQSPLLPLRMVGSATRPIDHSWRKINDPFPCTASVYWFPSSELRLAPDAWSVRVSSGLRGDECVLGDDKHSGNTCVLRIVCFWQVHRGRAPCPRGSASEVHHNAMLNIDRTDAQELEKRRNGRGHCGLE